MTGQPAPYADFLSTKRHTADHIGPPIDPDAVNPTLFDWQMDIVRWAVKAGRAAIFADCGLGKTFMQLEWARLAADRTLIVAPLSVARQTAREAHKLGAEVPYVRSKDDVTGDGIWITNYEMVDQFDAADFGAVVLDESSILKNVAGATRRKITEQFAAVDYRLACTATPAPNDITELCNHAEYLGTMTRPEMLALFFINDEFHGKTRWRLKGHARDGFYRWMSTWAVGVRRPSDLGYDDTGYELPELRIHGELVDAPIEADAGQLFASLGGVQGRHKVRRSTEGERVARAVELANSTDDQWIVWCGLNTEADATGEQIAGAVNVPGSWTPDRKAEAIEAFQDGEVRVLVTKPSIAGFGMNFQQCHRMAFVGLSDSYEAYYQAVRRCWRFGQTSPVDVHIVVSELEQEIVENVRAKESDASTFAAGLAAHSQVRKDT